MKRFSDFFTSAVFKLALVVLAVMIPMNMLTLSLSRTAIRENEKQFSLEAQKAMELYALQLDEAMKRVSAKMRQIATSNADFKWLNSKAVTNEEEYYEQLKIAVRLRKTLEEALNDNMMASGMYIYLPDSDLKILASSFSDYQGTLMEYINKNLSAERPGTVGRWDFIQTDKGGAVFFFADHKNTCFGAWFDLNSFLRMLDPQGEIEGGIAFMNGAGDIGAVKGCTAEEMAVICHDPERESYLVVEAESRYADLKLVHAIPQKGANIRPNGMLQLLSAAAVAAFVAIPVLLLAMRYFLMQPLNQLSFAMKRIEQGDMSFRIPEKSAGSEFEKINRNFNHMLDEVSELKIHVYEEQLEKQRIKMRFLSQQIQPHFFLNAMNILYSYRQEEHPLIQKMILCLSHYFRYVVNANEDFVELGEEMKHIKNYFEIQHTRYPEEFLSIVEWEEEVEECLLPPLLVQNFAENAIKHSLSIGNCIDIFVIAKRTEEGKVLIALSDTGEGISDETLEKIRIFRETRVYQKGLGVGIQNTIERLDVLYKGSAKLDIRRDKPHGTRVEIILEDRRKENEGISSR